MSHYAAQLYGFVMYGAMRSRGLRHTLRPPIPVKRIVTFDDDNVLIQSHADTAW